MTKIILEKEVKSKKKPWKNIFYSLKKLFFQTVTEKRFFQTVTEKRFFQTVMEKNRFRDFSRTLRKLKRKKMDSSICQGEQYDTPRMEESIIRVKYKE